MAKFTLTLDSSQLSKWEECPTAWYLGNVRRIESVPDLSKEVKINGVGSTKIAPAGSMMDMGTFGHKLLELFYKGLMEGKSREAAMNNALLYNIDKETCRCGHLHESHENGKCHTCKCDEFMPNDFPLDAEPRLQIIEKFVIHTQLYQSRDFIPQAAEVGFSEVIYEDDSYRFILEGKMDLICTYFGEQTWADHKFQRSKHQLDRKSIQFRNYSMVAKTSRGYINYIRMAKSHKDDTMERVPVSFSAIELDNWKSVLISKFFSVAQFLQTNNLEMILDPTLNNRRETSCVHPFWGKCDYYEICDTQSVSMKLVQIQYNYKAKPEWRPW